VGGLKPLAGALPLLREGEGVEGIGEALPQLGSTGGVALTDSHVENPF